MEKHEINYLVIIWINLIMKSLMLDMKIKLNNQWI